MTSGGAKRSSRARAWVAALAGVLVAGMLVIVGVAGLTSSVLPFRAWPSPAEAPAVATTELPAPGPSPTDARGPGGTAAPAGLTPATLPRILLGPSGGVAAPAPAASRRGAAARRTAASAAR